MEADNHRIDILHLLLVESGEAIGEEVVSLLEAGRTLKKLEDMLAGLTHEEDLV